MRHVSDKIYRGNKNTHFVFSNIISKIVSFGDNVEKYCRVGKTTGENMASTHCMLDN
jgi:hypothetical protein